MGCDGCTLRKGKLLEFIYNMSSSKRRAGEKMCDENIDVSYLNSLDSSGAK
jgi:hypothetical protein